MKRKKTDLLRIYEMMHRIRKFEFQALDFNAQGLVGGSIHLYIGEEAIASTVGHILRDDDYICSTHRGHGHVLGKGVASDAAMAEILGKETGSCRGRGGSMHIADRDKGVLGANGIVGGGIPCAAGAALSIRMRGTDQVSIAYFGDGAANEGAFHEAMNVAALWNLPMVFICENNLYGMTVSINESSKEHDIYKRAAGYGMPGEKADGNDVLAVYDLAEKAIDRARSGGGPSLIEFKTYRWRGHWEGDPLNYRTEKELTDWKKKDPIPRFEKVLMKDYKLTRTELDTIEQKMTEEIEAAAKFALESPYPDPSTVMDDVFTETGVK
ncbi:thiamine pyrophosphate-dependent dehydrogenase E1 component subunit alpha [Ruminococcaceae bacterium OttesenSCG-928-I18]|nr:thiamine pyrophosphate-dependent dehydrogenase E1 component subunit alpha [Ruminococcaceae bacterium OttesenSCG-928-I18]